MRLIDADRLLKKFNINDITTVGENHHVPILIARKAIEDAPTIIPAAANWTPCAEGLPTNSARYKVTLQVGSEMGTWRETAIIPYRYCDGVGEWILPKSDWLIYGVIAWTKADEPWTGGLDGK